MSYSPVCPKALLRSSGLLCGVNVFCYGPRISLEVGCKECRTRNVSVCKQALLGFEIEGVPYLCDDDEDGISSGPGSGSTCD